MTAAFTVQPEAEDDLARTFAWYERRRPGLGGDFLDEIDRVFAQIAQYPMAAIQVWREARRALPRRFPYAVFYVVRAETVFVLAVLHQRRDPSVARTRVREFRAGEYGQ